MATDRHTLLDSLWFPNSGKTAPKLDRIKLLAAKALAAYMGYASTRKVKIPEYTKIVLMTLVSELDQTRPDRRMHAVEPTQLQRVHSQ